jgi:hypothetical protein
MNTTEVKGKLRNFLSGIFALMILFSFNSCATEAKFLTSSVVPAARGTVKVKQDNNNNYVIDISLTDLAEVTRLEPSKHTYIVWMETDQELTKNLGQLNSSKGFMSKQLKGSLKTVTPFKPIKIFITAEDDPTIQYPGTQVVISTNKF